MPFVQGYDGFFDYVFQREVDQDVVDMILCRYPDTLVSEIPWPDIPIESPFEFGGRWLRDQ